MLQKQVSFEKDLYGCQSRRGIPCNFEDYFKIDFHDWMIIQTLLKCLPPLHSNIASVGWSGSDYN